MSVTIFKDVEEALAREVRRITTHSNRTLDKMVLKETYDPFSGEVITMPIEPEFYDSSADAGGVGYPHFFIRLMKTREDRFTGRVVPQYGKYITCPVIFSPKAFQIVLSESGLISVAGNTFTTSSFQIRKVQPGYLLRLLDGNNIGTYIINSITVNSNGNHSILVSDILLQNLAAFNFDSNLREVVYSNIDLNTIKVGDIFTDVDDNSFNITAIDAAHGKITIDGSITPNSLAGSSITRDGNVFQSTDSGPVNYLVMDPSKPVSSVSGGSLQATSRNTGVSPSIPIDAYYLVRIDSKTRQNHIDILNRIWEEFNPPRTALPVIARSALSADQLLTIDVSSGGSNTINIEDNTNHNVGDTVYIFDDLTPTKRVDGEGFQRPFQSIITDRISNNQLVLKDLVPDTYTVANGTRIVSNAELQLLMFHFVDHVTKDVEGSQYWVHEFTFWTQIFVDRLEQPSTITTITNVNTDIEDITDSYILSDEE